MTAYYLVNMSDTSDQQVNGGYFYSPATDRKGRAHYAYGYAKDIVVGDQIFINTGGIRYIGTVTSQPILVQNGPDFKNNTWNRSGWICNVDYRLVDQPIKLKEHKDTLLPLSGGKYGPLDKNGGAKQKQYISVLNHEFAQALFKLVNEVIQVDLEHFTAPLAPMLVTRSFKQRVRSLSESKKAKLRANGHCECCGISFKWLQGAHIKPHSNLESHDVDYNIAGLCPNCHTTYDKEEPARQAEIREQIYANVPYLAKYRHLTEA